MEDHIKNKLLFTVLFIVLIVFVVVVFAVAIKTDRETPVQEPEDISVIDAKIFDEYEKGTNSEETVSDDYVLDNGIYYLADHALIKFNSKTTQNKALSILGDFADAYEYHEDDDSYEVILKKTYSYNDLIKYCNNIINSYSRVTSCEVITK